MSSPLTEDVDSEIDARELSVEAWRLSRWQFSRCGTLYGVGYRPQEVSELKEQSMKIRFENFKI